MKTSSALLAAGSFFMQAAAYALHISWTNDRPSLANRQFDVNGFGSNSGSTRNDLKDEVWKPLTAIFARGTGEIGQCRYRYRTAVLWRLEAAFGANEVVVQAVDYAGTVAGFVHDFSGLAEMASLANDAAADCLTTQIVISRDN